MPDRRTLASALVIAATVFNAILCLLKTEGLPIGLPVVQAVELAIVGGAGLLVVPFASGALQVASVLFGLNILALALVGGGMDFQIGLDIAIIGVFVLLGRYATPHSAGLVLWAMALLTFAFGLYEMFALDSFERYFHIYDYYVGKGALDANHAGDTGTLLAENGVRPEDQGRQLLPGLLSLHRVGSIFLEPVSAGNFAVICIIWVCARRDLSWQGICLAALGVAIGILADARFSILCGGAIAALLLTPLWRSRVFIGLLPIVLVALLCVLGAFSDREVDNSILGRLTGSGQLLDSWSVWQWIGVSPDRWISMDTGYSYVIGNTGIVAALLMWAAVCIAAPREGAAGRLFAAAAIYLSLSLCISKSGLSIKTAALLWFGFGALASSGERAAAQGLAWAREAARASRQPSVRLT